MEGMPRFPMISPEIRVAPSGLPDDFALKIKEFILLHFQDEPSNYDEPISEIINLKKRTLHAAPDVETTCLLKRYYAQLVMMKNRFPMEEGDELEISFTWSDRTMDMPHTVAYEDIAFELASIMFNIGAVHATIGRAENREDENSIKNAFMHFQYAAWPLQQVRDTMHVDKYSTLDFDKELLTFFVNVLLAQAQECLVEKSLIDHRSNVVVAKLSIHLRDLYRECARHLEQSSLSDAVSSQRYKEWVCTCAAKSELYGAIAALYMGMQADDDHKYGARLAYYAMAMKHVKIAVEIIEKKDKRPEMVASANFIHDVVYIKEQNARKENDVVYHERVPKDDELVLSEGLCKVKPLAFDSLDPSVGGDDLFGSLLPPTVLKAVSEYEEEKAKLKRSVLEKVASKDMELNEFLLRLGVSELCLDGDGAATLPDMLLERNAAFNSEPDAFPQLLEKIGKVAERADKLNHQISDMTRRLDVVNLPKLVEDEGFKVIHSELTKMAEQQVSIRSQNTEGRRLLATHSESLRLLALPLSQLEHHVSANDFRPVASPEGIVLKKMLDKTSEMSAQRIKLVQRLDDEIQRDNVGKRLLTERELDNKATFARELEKHNETINYIDQNLAAQDKILHALTEANADFADLRKKIENSKTTRDKCVLTLVGAYDAFAEVLRGTEKSLSTIDFAEKRLARIAPALDSIETAFFSEKEKLDAEKRVLAERMERIRREKDAREAISDFGVVSPTAHSVPMTAPMPAVVGGRRDYLEFFRAKMGRVDGPHVRPSNIPSSLPVANMPSSAFTGPPPHPGLQYSPTPSVIGGYNYQHSPTQPDGLDLRVFTPAQRREIHEESRAPLPAASVAPSSATFSTFAHPVHQPLTHPMPLQGELAQAHGQLSGATTPMLGPPGASSFLLAQVQSNVPTALTAPPAQYNPPVTPLHTIPPPASIQSAQKQNLHNLAFSSPYSGPHKPSFAAQRSVHQTAIVQTPISQHGGLQNSLPYMLPNQQTAPHVDALNIPGTHPNSLSAVGRLQPTSESQASAVEVPDSTPIRTPQLTEQKFQHAPIAGFNGAVNHQIGYDSQYATNISPWHQGVGGRQPPYAGSPWHTVPTARGQITHPSPAGVHIVNGSVAPDSLLHAASYTSTNVAQTLPQSVAAKSEQQAVSNADLLGSLLGDLELPPALQPSSEVSFSNPVTRQVLVTPEAEKMPMAVVAPMPKESASPASSFNTSSSGLPLFAPTSILPSTATKGQQRILTLNEVTDPSQFQLGPEEKQRLDKKLLHASFKGQTSKPSLDPNDPLNQLDPFWKSA